MAKKAAPLTARQRQSQQIMREKAARKKRKALVRRCTLIGTSLFCTAALLSGLWCWKSGTLARTAQDVSDRAYKATADSGFALQTLYLEGRNRTAMQDIEQALDVKKGDPILRLSLDEMRARLEKIESVRFADVERSLPGTLYVRISEREPAALWQHGGKVTVVDDNGVAMNGIDVAPYSHLPLVIGDDAPNHIIELVELLSSQPDLAKRFTAAIRVGERRWNIRLEGNVEVRLPEENPTVAWKKLATLQADEQLLDRNIKVIDMRLSDRLFIKLSPDALTGKPGARET